MTFGCDRNGQVGLGPIAGESTRQHFFCLQMPDLLICSRHFPATTFGTVFQQSAMVGAVCLVSTKASMNGDKCPIMPNPNKIVGIDSPTKAPPTSSNIISGTKVPTFFPGCLTSCVQRWLLSASLPRGSKRGNLLSQLPCQDRVRGLWRNAGLWCWWESSSVKTAGLWLACRAFMTVSVYRWPKCGGFGIHRDTHVLIFMFFSLTWDACAQCFFLGHGSGVETSHQTLTADCCSSGAKLFPFMAVASHRAELSGSLPCFVSQRVEGCVSAGGECLVVTVYDLIFWG